MSDKMTKPLVKENPAEVSDAGSHLVPCTVEAGVFEHMDKVNHEFADKYYADEQARIAEANRLAHEHLEHDQETRVFGLHQAPQFYETDPDGAWAKSRREGIHVVEPVEGSKPPVMTKHNPDGEK
jgi:hypothetical protein